VKPENDLLVEMTDSEELKKKAYVKPRLTPYGDVEELTRGISGQATDGFDGSAPGDAG